MAYRGYTLFPNDQGLNGLSFTIETQKGSPKRLKFCYWLDKYIGDYIGEYYRG